MCELTNEIVIRMTTVVIYGSDTLINCFTSIITVLVTGIPGLDQCVVKVGLCMCKYVCVCVCVCQHAYELESEREHSA